MKKTRLILQIALVVLCFISVNHLKAQKISDHFFGQNAWILDSLGTRHIGGNIHKQWAKTQESKVQIVRFGGIETDHYKASNYQLIKFIDSVRTHNMEPMIQVNCYGGMYTAQQAADMVQYINVTKGKNVKYWVIGNEPNDIYKYKDAQGVDQPYRAPEIAAYIKSFSSAMKAIDPSIIIIGPECSWLDSSIYTPLTTPGGPYDITGKDANGRYYVDIISYHSYPFDGSQTRQQVTSYYAGKNLNYLNTQIANCNSYYNRTGNSALKIAMTEAYISFKASPTEDLYGPGSNSFLGGQFNAEIYGFGMRNNIYTVDMWCISSRGYMNTGTGETGPTYHHFKMLAENFKGNVANATSNQSLVKTIASVDSQYINLMVMNEDQTNNFNYTVRLNTSAVSGTNPLKINVDAGVAAEYSDVLSTESSVVLTFNLAGKLVKKTVYTLANHAAQNLPPTVYGLPTVALTSPSANANFKATDVITLTANATHADGIAKVEFFQGNTKLGEDLSAPYSYSWTGAQDGTYSITVKATDNNGIAKVSDAVNITVGQTQLTTAVLNPTADSYVKQSTATTNYGTANVLEVKNDISSGLTREAYLKFDMNGVSNFDKATLRLNIAVSNTTTAQTTWQVYYVPTDSWTESGINWSNKPATSTLLATITGKNSGFAEWDISAQTLAEFEADKVLSLKIVSTLNNTTNNASFSSKEATDATLRPQLTLASQSVISIISPVTGSTFSPPGAIHIEANAMEANGTTTKVEYFEGTNKIGEATVAPFSFDWINVPAGNYDLTAKATNSEGAIRTSEIVAIKVNTLPTVAITSPSNNTSFNNPATIIINANATDANGSVSKVEFFLGTTKLGEDLTAPYSFIAHNITEGNYALTAKVTDNLGSVITSEVVNVMVNPTIQISTHTTHPDAQWWPSAEFGMFIHWGIPSVNKVELSWPMMAGSRKVWSYPTPTDQELQTYLDNGDFFAGDPCVSKNTCFTANQYWAQAQQFNPTSYDPEAWVKKAKAAGMTYVVFTTRHHDGFALWPSNYGNFSTKNYMGGRDLVKEYVDACRKYGLKVGLYYSGPDWYKNKDFQNFLFGTLAQKFPNYPALDANWNARTTQPTAAEQQAQYDEFVAYYNGQINELLNNYGKIDVLWFDGGPDIPGNNSARNNLITLEQIRQKQPGIVVSPRFYGYGDFGTPEGDDAVPTTIQSDWTESCVTIENGKWGYTGNPIKTSNYALGLLAQCKSVNTNFLLNFGPDKDGVLSPDMVNRLDNFAAWMNVNKVAVFGTHALDSNESASVPAVANDAHRYLFVVSKNPNSILEAPALPLPAQTITLKTQFPINSIKLLGQTAVNLQYTVNNGVVTIQVPSEVRTINGDVIDVSVIDNRTTVALTSPSANANFKASEVITLTANATDVDGITKVEFFQNGNKIGEDLSAPYSCSWTGAQNGTYSITAIVTDSNGIAKASEAVKITVGQTHLTTAVLAPVADSYVRDGSSASTNFGTVSTLVVKKDASSLIRESYLKFDLNAANSFDKATLRLNINTAGVNVGQTTWQVYYVPTDSWTETGLTWSNKPAEGTLLATINAKNSGWAEWDISTQALAELGADKILSLKIVSTVANSTADVSFNSKEALDASLRPQLSLASQSAVSIISPSTGAAFTAPAAIHIEANAVDAAGTISKVEYFEGTNKIGEATVAPYSFDWTNVPGGNYNLTAKATNSAGEIRTSEIVAIKVNALPTVAITSPSNNSIFSDPATIIINANAADAGGSVSMVEFFAGTTKLGEDYIAPYSFTWNNATGGNYALTAKVTDNLGLVTTSEVVNVIVNPATYITAGTLSPVADAYVKQSTATTNYGTANVLEVKNDIASGLTREAYLKFDLNGVSNFDKATLRLNIAVSNTTTAQTTWQVYYVPTDSWTESGINWSNKPATGTLLATITGKTSGFAEWNITAQTLAELGADKVLSLKIVSTLNNTTNNASFSSKEATDATLRPQLLLIAKDRSPVVSLTSPSTGAGFNAASTVTIAANATDIDGTIAKVEFFNGATKLGEDLTSPYSFDWQNVAAGSYTLTAKATDNYGVFGTSDIVSITVNALPTAAITSPANNTSYNAPATVIITADAADTDGTISKVEFFNGATKLGESSTTPYSFDWANVATGSYAITAKVTDDKGAVTASEIVNVSVNALPTIAITSPVNNASYNAPATVTITADAADADGSVSKVEFFNGGTKLGEATTAPYSFDWANVAAGSYALTAKVTDNNNAVVTSEIVNVTVNALPTVAITSPVNNASYDALANITITANATDADGSVSKVEFFNGATKLGEDSTAPYSFDWSNVAADSYALTAKATDNNGAVTTSTVVNVNVVCPTVQLSIPDVYAMNPSIDDKNTIYLGYGPTSITLNALAQGAQDFTYNWSTGATGSSISVSEAGTYTVTALYAGGCQSTASITINTLDVRCGNNDDKVQICHNNNVICVAESAVLNHLNHGDKLGSCSTSSRMAVKEEVSTSPNFTVYPNPAQDSFNVSVSSKLDPNATISIYNILGNKIRQVRFTTVPQNVFCGDLPSGNYIIVIQNGVETFRSTIVKQ